MISKNVSVRISDKKADRPVALLVQMASQFESKILIETENKQINMKSIMGMMSLGLTQIENLTVIADGKDETDAVKEIEKYLTSGN